MKNPLLKSLLPVALCLATFHSGAAQAETLLQRIEQTKMIRIAVPADSQPFGFVGTDLQPQGLDVDMARIVAKGLGARVELIPVTSENRVAYVQSHKADIVISTLAKNADREKVVDFTQAYSPFFQAVYGIPSMHVKTWADLADKTIGVTRGSVEDQTVSKMVPSSTKVLRFIDNGATVQAYVSGQVQFIATGTAIVATMMRKNPSQPCEFKILMKDSPNYIGVTKGEKDLVDRINAIIDTNRANGELDRLAQKWLGAYAKKPATN